MPLARLIVSPVDRHIIQPAHEERADRTVPDDGDVASSIRFQQVCDGRGDPPLSMVCRFPPADGNVRFGEEPISEALMLLWCDETR